MSRKYLTRKKKDLDCSMGLGREPRSVSRDFGEDAGFAGAGAGNEGTDPYDVIAAPVGADEGSTKVGKAGRPFARFAESDHMVGKRRVLTLESAGGPDLAGDLLETVGESLRVAFDQTPTREHAVLSSTIVLASRRQACGAGIGSGEVDRFGQLYEGDIIVELLEAEFLVDMDFRDGVDFFGSILRSQVPFTNVNRVDSGIQAVSKATGGAEDILLK